MKVRLLLAMFLLCLSGPSAWAQAIGDAGCGLGSMIIQENTKGGQLVAATTNILTGTMLFGITTGTSNCRSQNFVLQEKAVQYFAEVNQEDLSREMSQGYGEKLVTLASLYGCRGQAAKDFGAFTQTSFTLILPSAQTSVTEMVQNLNQLVLANPVLAHKCRAG